MTAASPIGRLTSLDGLRGVAVMGILLMNIVAFAQPFAAYSNPAALGAPSPADLIVWTLQFLLVDGKMRALFSALFGASLLLVIDRADAAGVSGARRHYARMATLLLFGLIHGLLIWDGDILVLYALTGMIAFAARRLPAERLLVLAGLLLVFQGAFLAASYAGFQMLETAAHAPGATPDTIAAWQAMLGELGRPTAATIAAEVARHGDWLALTRSRVDDIGSWIPTQLMFSGPETLALMLIGMAGLRSGFLGWQWPVAAYRRVARIGYLLALPPLAGIAAWLILHDFPPLPILWLTSLAAMPLRWIVALAHAALILAWFAGPDTALKRRVAAAGRAAFSNYLGTSIAMTLLFDRSGLFGRLDRWMLIPIAIAAWAVMLAWSKPWLERFTYGPLEWLWRMMARGSVPPLRRKDIAS